MIYMNNFHHRINMKSLLKRICNMLGFDLTKTKDKIYLKALVKILEKEKSPIIFDVGAHYGETEKIMSSIFINSKIFCFEPFVPSFEILARSANISTRLYNFGFSDFSGESFFESNYYDATNSLLPLAPDVDLSWTAHSLRPKERLKCQFSTIDDFVAANSITRIDLLKIDVQGSEYKVISGASKALTNKIIQNIYMEIIICSTYVGQWSLEKYITELGAYGYELIGFYNLCYTEKGGLSQLDAIFSLRI